ncbi:MAG TPA: metal-sensing transcriptional repressor [Candidatus Jorgensenbacteria bacterium]|uniref:Metal-sensitive transcriptional regulator n=1 Tax=marine sediment metagenome TaxID=412755 RepID=A0A0F9GXZ6_9ZZZZ|nr:metal-sensing transcriptional repressor [Candidatus Jorgensenbacteria bacterium]
MKPEIKKQVVRRLKIAEGQIRGLQRMVDKEEYCIDIITQSLAIKQALSSVEDLLLENHLSSHVINQIKSGKEGKAIKEIMTVYKISKKK